MNVPMGVAGFIFGALFLPEHREASAGRTDLPGFVLAGGGLSVLMYALPEGPSQGWTSPVIKGTELAPFHALRDH